MSFVEIASQIVKDSIRSAVCIDNDFAEPYEETDKYNKDYPKKLYYSFREVGECTLDFYRYRGKSHWDLDVEFVLSNKDLIVLDWELEDTAPKYKNTLVILEDVIKRGRNQFLIIYTNHDQLEEIVQNIQAFYDDVNISVPDSKDQGLIEIFENEEGGDFKDLEVAVETLIGRADIFNSNIKISDLLKEAGVATEKIGGLIQKFKNVLSINKESDIVKLLSLSFFKLRTIKASLPRPVCEVSGEETMINIENTIVLIKNKKNINSDESAIEPDNLFSAFQKAIIQKPSNAMALMACELKNIFRLNSSIVGNNIPKLDEKAFYHHWANLRVEEGTSQDDADYQFRYFLLQTWLNELSQFTLNGNTESKFFEALKHYGNEKNLFEIEEHDSIFDELTKLGAHYSTINILPSQRPDKKIQFGDIFWKQDATSSMNEVFMSITPHCDSIRPEKIGNLLHFVKGDVVSGLANKKLALNDSEKDYYSFLFVENKPIVIKWKPKPFTLYIQKENNVVNKLVPIKYQDRDFNLKYVSTLKENYTQRVANHSFGEAMRVGITLPH